MGGAFKNHIFVAVVSVFLYLLVEQITGFGQVFALTMLQHFFSNYGVIDEIDLKENAVKMMGRYNPAETLD